MTSLGERWGERRSFNKIILKAESAEKTTLEAGSRNAKIIDKYRLKFTAKVSRKGSEKKIKSELRR